MRIGNAPGMELPGIDFPSLAKAFGCKSIRVDRAADVAHALAGALREPRPMVVDIAVDPDTGDLY
jgi:benzoylformate decarboxylase